MFEKCGRAGVVSLMFALTPACRTDKPVPPDLAAAAFCTDSMPLAPTFDNVSKLFDNQCTSCHAETTVDLTRDHILSTLIRRAVPVYQTVDDSCGGLLVVPGDAGVSYLVHKITDPIPCGGSEMPIGEFGNGGLAPCEQRLVIDWINAGAPGP